jgi:hypothetical protein
MRRLADWLPVTRRSLPAGLGQVRSLRHLDDWLLQTIAAHRLALLL